MSQKIDTITACNEHDPFLGSFQYGGTASLSTRNFMGRRTASGRYPFGLVRWSWQKFRGQGNTYLRITTFSLPVPPSQGGRSGSVYSQNLTFFNSISRRLCHIQGFLRDQKEKIDQRNREGYMILLMGDFNDYILSYRSRLLFSKLRLR